LEFEIQTQAHTHTTVIERVQQQKKGFNSATDEHSAYDLRCELRSLLAKKRVADRSIAENRLLSCTALFYSSFINNIKYMCVCVLKCLYDIYWVEKENQTEKSTRNYEIYVQFLPQVVHSRRESDAGTYWCEAKNEMGVVRSRNATVQVAGKFLYFLLLLLSMFDVNCKEREWKRKEAIFPFILFAGKLFIRKKNNTHKKKVFHFCFKVFVFLVADVCFFLCNQKVELPHFFPVTIECKGPDMILKASEE
jgi:hypothetical protein